MEVILLGKLKIWVASVIGYMSNPVTGVTF
jgi:hypothetical protein